MNETHDDPAQDAGPGIYTAELIADLYSEQHVLRDWARDTQHPRLALSYQSLAERTAERAERILAQASQARPELREEILRRAPQAHDAARQIDFELSRLKWLLANRRARITHDALPAADRDRDAEAEEAEELQALIHGMARGLC